MAWTLHSCKNTKERETLPSTLCWTPSTTLRGTGPSVFWCCTRPPHRIVPCLGSTTYTCSSPFGLRKRQSPQPCLALSLLHTPYSCSWFFLSPPVGKSCTIVSCPLGFASTNRVLPPALVQQVSSLYYKKKHTPVTLGIKKIHKEWGRKG